MEYKASLDILSKFISAFVVILFIGIGQKSARALLVAHGDTTIILVHTSVLIFLAGTLLYCYLFSPQSYRVEHNELVIHRPAKDRTINIADVAEIRILNHGELSGTIRTFGNG